MVQPYDTLQQINRKAKIFALCCSLRHAWGSLAVSQVFLDESKAQNECTLKSDYKNQKCCCLNRTGSDRCSGTGGICHVTVATDF